jgi:hypothetical protein
MSGLVPVVGHAEEPEGARVGAGSTAGWVLRGWSGRVGF